MSEVPDLLSQVPFEVIWSALVDGSEDRVGITSREGEILWVNEIAKKRHAQRTGGDPIGKSVFEFVTPKVAQELRRAKERTIATGRPIVVETTINGVRTHLTYRAFLRGQEHLFLVVARDMAQPLSDDSAHVGTQDFIKTDSTDLGPLSKLTRKELEVLALMGEHLSSQGIADRLERSVKTIEWHRVSIGRKLKVKTRGELAIIAQRAGLVKPPPNGTRPNDP